MTLEELKNKRVIITSEPLIFKLTDDLDDEILQEILENNQTEEEVLEYIKTAYYSNCDIQDCLDIEYKTIIY